MPLISVTRLRVRSWMYFPEFVFQSLKVAKQAERSAGFLGGKLLRNAGSVFWTMTAWQEEEAMNSFRIESAHGRVMPKLLNWCDEAAVVHWNQDTPDIPSWQDAHQRMTMDGRLSKVRHPSPAQILNHIPVPEPSRIQLDLKPPPAN